jgi:tRNA G18 (ribose-2'-O)-methylase SpoU
MTFENYDERNIADKFKGMTVEAINDELDDWRMPFQVWFFNLTSDFNKATGIRNANAFGAEQVVLVGSKKYDKRGAVGAYNYTRVAHVPEDQAYRSISEASMLGHTIVGVELTPDATPLSRFRVDPLKHYIFIFGEESAGLSEETMDLCDEIVYIPQFGSVRSLNVGTASGIIMNDFVTKYLEWYN